MKIISLEISGAYEIKLKPFKDDRGYFMRTYEEQLFREQDLNTSWVHENHSFSKLKGTVRGFHFQHAPDSEVKIARVSSGAIFFVYLDLRKDSATFGKHGTLTVSEEKQNMLYISKGLALCMQTQEDNCHLHYKFGAAFSPDKYDCLLWNDPTLNIAWPIPVTVISEKDSCAQSFEEFKTKYGGL